MSFGLLAAVAIPRLILGGMWLIGERVERVFDNEWFWPVLGIVLFPWATIIYVVLWAEGEGVTSGQWAIVGVAAFADVVSWFAGAPERSHRYP
jgi:hypothetical protein